MDIHVHTCTTDYIFLTFFKITKLNNGMNNLVVNCTVCTVLMDVTLNRLCRIKPWKCEFSICILANVHCVHCMCFFCCNFPFSRSSDKMKNSCADVLHDGLLYWRANAKGRSYWALAIYPPLDYQHTMYTYGIHEPGDYLHKMFNTWQNWGCVQATIFHPRNTFFQRRLVENTVAFKRFFLSVLNNKRVSKHKHETLKRMRFVTWFYRITVSKNHFKNCLNASQVIAILLHLFYCNYIACSLLFQKFWESLMKRPHFWQRKITLSLVSDL